MAPKRARHRPESALKKRRRCQAARDVLAALCPPPPGHRINRAAAAASTGLQLGIGVEARGIAINAVRIVIVINLNDRTDRWNQFRCRSDAVDWQRGAEVVRLPAATPSHAMLAKGSEFGAVAKQNVHESIMKRNKCRACVLSHILALKKLEERKLTPALICKDDLVLTKEDAMRRVPLPALAAVVSVGHDPLVSADAPIAYEGGGGEEALVAVRETGYKSSSAGYLVPTRAKGQELRARLEKELRDGLRAPMDNLLFHPRLFEDQPKSVYLIK